MKYTNTFTKLLFSLLLLLPFALFATENEVATGKVAGTITSTDGKPVPDATVTLIELKRSVSTQANGTYLLQQVKPGSYTLAVTFIGAETQQKTIEVALGKTTTANFTLSETSKQIQEVVVSSGKTLNSKRPTLDKAGISPLDLPQSTGYVSSQVMRDQQVNRLADAVRNVSGVTLTQSRGGTSETFSARGYSIGIGGGSGSIFKNGVLSNTSNFPETAGLESVEVLKGSSALLYGNTSGGLIINMVTKKPKFEQGGEVSFRTGSNNAYKPVVDVYGPVSKDLAYRLVTTYSHEGSYRDQVKGDRFYVNPSLLYNAGKSTTILVEGDFLKSNLTPDWGLGTIGGQTIPNVPRSRFINTNWAFNHMNQYTGDVNVNHNFSDNWRLNAIASVQSTAINAYGSGLPNNILANGDWSRGLQRTNTKENNYTGQLNLTGRFSTGFLGHQLLVGTDAARVINFNNGYTINGKSGSYTYDQINVIDPLKYTARTDIPDAVAITTTRSPANRWGAYVQDLVTIVPKVKVLAGVRYSLQRTQLVDTTFLITGRKSQNTFANTYSAFSPKAALIYQPISTTSIYASYSNNFIVNTGTDISGRALDPSTVDQYEAGIKNEFFNGKLSANLSVYRIRNSNLAVAAPFGADGKPNSNTTFKQLNGQTTSDGFELDLNGNLSKYFYFIAGYGYNYARYTKTTGLKGSPNEGERLVNNPRHTANGSAFYTFHKAFLKGVKVGASAFYTGARYGGYNNTVGQTQTYNRQVPLKGFTTVDLSAGYTYTRFSILASVTNVGNTLSYLIHDNYSITPIAPRQFFTTIAYKF
ncbi:TonB-dependent receptor [Mucilaginibacter sp. RS28]|uniref:TonB-dependent receptor n=1 Tax=Mucilaginibacter straminoryzae TaxID=2932774 RepID=A0A9X1X6L6_9SPHI|nr:TonB-dependent receptor [Mucilaginibacter straminoryzae]MCJ8211310.1 TonB-dependent receptor [Mucilaginibacter straminoryzae]